MTPLSTFLRRVAHTYATAQHTPRDPYTAECYCAFAQVLSAQYALLTAYVNVEFTDIDPYPTSEPMWHALGWGHLQVYTYADLPPDHLMNRQNSRGHVNLMFRAVHDAFAHYPERLRHDGLDREPGYDEFHAFRAHVRLMHGNLPAISALFTETVAQNASYHYGLTPGTFPPQKAVILPQALILEAFSLEV